MNSNSIREKVHNDAVKSIITNNFNGIIIVAPRVGKTKIALTAIAKAKSTIWITSPYSVIKNNWNIENKKWNINAKIHSICHKSLHKLPKHLPLLIIDEIQELSLSQIQNIVAAKPQRILGLSGFLSSYTILLLHNTLRLNIFFKYTINQAIHDKIISDFRITILKVGLDSVNKNQLLFNNRVTEREKYNFYTKKYEEAKENDDIYLKNFYSRKRKEFIYNNHSKSNLCKLLLETVLKNERVICFGSSVNKIEKFCAKTYHVENKKEDNLTKFINNEFNHLGVIQMVNMGVTIMNLKIALIGQVISSNETSIQRILRVCNLEENRTAHIIIIVVKDTIDEEWCENSLIGISQEQIERFNFTEKTACTTFIHNKVVCGRNDNV